MGPQQTDPIGKIVKSNSHIDYVCQVYAPGEIEIAPAADAFSFGRLVRIDGHTSAPADLIGIIYNTLLLNPEFGNLGPRLSTGAELEIFSPDYLSEKATLVGILVLGSLPQAEGTPAMQGIPPYSAGVDALVYPLSERECRRFHAGQPEPRLAYLPHLLSQPGPSIPYLALSLLDDLRTLFPDASAQINVLRSNLAWRTLMERSGA